MMKPSYAALLEALKRSDGLPVSDLARELKMSYMGVKQHCLNLHKKGYLEEWRVPREKKEVGRPEKIYRLTSKCDDLFPQGGGEVTLAVLDGLRQVYGESAPEKMMFHFFQNLETRWSKKVEKGASLDEKAKILTDLRDKEGWFSRLRDDDGGLRLVEFHNPLRKIYEKYPSVERMEVMMTERLLASKIERKEVSFGKKGRRIEFELRAPAETSEANLAVLAVLKKESSAETENREAPPKPAPQVTAQIPPIPEEKPTPRPLPQKTKFFEMSSPAEKTCEEVIEQQGFLFD